MSKEYDEYLRAHIRAVRNAAGAIVTRLPVRKWLTDEEVDGLLYVAALHDRSKFGPEEYDAYDAYFYGERDEEAFDRAWLHHIHCNQHHWQHWLLMNDDGKYRDPDKVIALEMPKIYAFEMIADWWSFSWRSGDLTSIFGWYDEHRDCIILHPETRRLVESVLADMRESIS